MRLSGAPARRRLRAELANATALTMGPRGQVHFAIIIASAVLAGTALMPSGAQAVECANGGAGANPAGNDGGNANNTACGTNATATGANSTAIGVNSTASGPNSTASGDSSTAVRRQQHRERHQQHRELPYGGSAYGNLSTASGVNSTAVARAPRAAVAAARSAL